MKKRHLSLLIFTIGESCYYRLFKILNEVCSVICFSNDPIIRTPANANQLIGFSITQALTKYISKQTIILVKLKEYKRKSGSGTAKTSHTNPPILKLSDWNQ